MISEPYLPLNDPHYQPAWRGVTPVECNLVLEGGAMRGMFTAGVLDLLMDKKTLPSTVIGVSAGALNGYNFVAGMRGRALFLNTKYCNDWRYYSLRSLLLKRSAFDVDFVYHSIMYELDPFDFESFIASPARLITVAADLVTGQADYHETRDLKLEMDYLRASASMPLLAQTVLIDGKRLLDGGICDSVPIEYSKSLKATKHIVVLTQDASYVKGPNTLMPLAHLFYRRYPRFIEAMARRHETYNRTYRQVAQMHEDGEIFLIRPQQPVKVARMEHDRNKLCELYVEGYEEASRQLPALLAYLKR